MDTKKLEIENLENMSEMEVLTEDELESVVGGFDESLKDTLDELPQSLLPPADTEQA